MFQNREGGEYSGGEYSKTLMGEKDPTISGGRKFLGGNIPGGVIEGQFEGKGFASIDPNSRNFEGGECKKKQGLHNLHFHTLEIVVLV